MPASADDRGEVESARANARAGGPVSERDAELLERYGCLSGTRSQFCERPYQGRRYYRERRRDKRRIKLRQTALGLGMCRVVFLRLTVSPESSVWIARGKQQTHCARAGKTYGRRVRRFDQSALFRDCAATSLAPTTRSGSSSFVTATTRLFQKVIAVSLCGAAFSALVRANARRRRPPEDSDTLFCHLFLRGAASVRRTA